MSSGYGGRNPYHEMVKMFDVFLGKMLRKKPKFKTKKLLYGRNQSSLKEQRKEKIDGKTSVFIFR